MTIKVERDALLRVLQRQPCCSSSRGPIGPEEEEVVLVDLCDTFSSSLYPVKTLLHSTADDDDSVFTLSTASLSSDDSSVCDLPKRVTFAEPLVTEVWTRPFTEKDSGLYYSVEETAKFRQEYRLERKLLAELSLDPETCSTDNGELSSFIATSNQPRGRHCISRVVVLHNDKLETFVSPDETSICTVNSLSGNDFFDNDSFWSGSITWY